MAIQSLRRDAQPIHDSDYRSLAMFLGSLPPTHTLGIRVFGARHSGSGETALQINAIRGMATFHATGFVGVLASNGHRKWLHPGPETLPCAWRDWATSPADFVAVFPIMGVNQLLDGRVARKETHPRVARRQRWREEETPLATPAYYHSTKRADIW